MTNVATTPVQAQPPQQGTSKAGMFLSSVADTAITAGAGAGVGAAIGTVTSFVKPPNKDLLRQNIHDVFVANNKSEPVVANYRKAVAVGAKLNKEGVSEEVYKNAKQVLDSAKQALDETILKITKDDTIYKEAKKLTKKFSRAGIIGMFAVLGAVGFMLASTLKGFLPIPKAKEEGQMPADALADQKPATQSLGTFQG